MITNLPDLSKGAIAQPTSYNIVTSTEAATLMPQVVSDLWLGYGQGLTLLDTLEYGFKDRSELVPAESWDAWLENFPLRTMTVGSSVTVSTTPGGLASFTLDADDLTANYDYLPRKYQQCFVGTPGNYVACRIENIVPQSSASPIIYVAPASSSVTLDASYISTGVVFALGGITMPVESGPTTPTKPSYDKVTFYTQVQKEASGFGGMELARQKWFNVDGGYLFSRDTMQKEWQIKSGMNMSLLLGQQTTNPLCVNVSDLDSTTNIPNKTNIGLWEWGKLRGWDNTFNTVTGFKVTDLDAVGEYYRSVGCSAQDVLVEMGGGLGVQIENSCKEYITGSTGALNDLFTPGGDNKDLKIGFKSIYKNGYTFILQQDHTFNNPNMLKNLMYNAALFIPMTTVKNGGDAFGSAGGYGPNLSIKYVGLRTYSRKMIVGKLGGMDGYMNQAFGLPILHGSDFNQTNWLTQWGSEIRNPYELIRCYGI